MTDHSLATKVKRIIDTKTKPLGALGRLEGLAERICLIQGTTKPSLKNPHMLVFAGDHGLAKEAAVSAFPSEVTRQMVMNFAAGGAAINVFCRQNGLTLKVIDAGVAGAEPFPETVVACKVAEGTANSLVAEAMTPLQLEQCLDQGAKQVSQAVKSGCNVLGLGEMGIGNTSCASLITSALLDIPIAEVVGRGTGLDDEGYRRKVTVLEEVHSRRLARGPLTTKTVLQRVGGFEVNMMVGAFLEGYRHNLVMLVDGFIASAAFLAACKIQPELAEYGIFCHASRERGHQAIYENFGQEPLLNLDMALGEGTGVALAYPIVESSVRFFNEMASFDEAGVSTADAIPDPL